MLDTLRANSRSVLTYVLFGIIIVVFVVSFGPGSRGCTDTGVLEAAYAAKVNGVTITAADFQQHYGQVFRSYQQRAGQAFTRELADQLGLRSVAMNQLVERELVIEEARRRGVRVGDDDLNRAVKEIPAFQTDGRFDYELYTRAVAGAYGSPGNFEERLRSDLAYQKMLALLRETVNVAPDEVREAWLAESDRASLVAVRFPLAAARSEVKVTDAEVKAFLAANGPRVDQFYKDNPARFEKKKRVRARHILVRVSEKAAAAEDAAARGRIEALAERARKGEDFAKLAAEASEDPGSKDRGGELGFFGEGTMAKPFEDAAFALQPGQISGPVRTRFGWHLVQVEEVQPPQSTPLEAARPEIARELAETEAAKALLRKKAEAALAAARAGKPLASLYPPADAGKDEKAPKAAPVKIGGQVVAAEETGPFSRSGDYVPRLGAVPGLAADAFLAGTGQVLGRVYETPTGPVVAVVKERQKPDPARFAERSEEISSRLRNRREAQVEASWLKELREKADVKVNEAFIRGEVPIRPMDLE